MAAAAVTSLSIGPPSSFAVQVRLTPPLKKQLLEAHERGQPCSIRLSDTSGSGACLIIGDQRVNLTSSSLTDGTELMHKDPGASSGSSTVAKVTCKMAPQRGNAVGGKGGSLAEKAELLQEKLDQPSGKRAVSRPNNPQPSGRTTAPQRSSLMIRKKTSPPADQLRTTAHQPPPERNAPPSGSPLTQEQVQSAFREGLRMGLAALLATNNLSCDTLVKKCGEAHKAHHLRTSTGSPPIKQDVMKELKHIAQFRAPGVYRLLDPARKELEDLLEATKRGGRSGGSNIAKKTSPLSAGRTKPSKTVMDRDWTSELTNGSSPPGSSAVKRKAPGSVAAISEAAVHAPRPQSTKGLKKSKPPSAADNQHRRGHQSDGMERNHHSNSVESTDTCHSLGLDNLKGAKRHATKKSGNRNGEHNGSDCSWFQEFAVRKPVRSPGPICSPEELEISASEYTRKYKIYHRLHHELQGVKERASRLADDERKGRSEAAATLRQLWSSRKHQLMQMQAAFQCLHEELSGLKSAAREFVTAYGSNIR